MFLPSSQTIKGVTHSSISENLKFLEKHAVLKSELRRSTFSHDEVELWQTKEMATMLPDEIILHNEKKEMRHYEAAIMIADATGFTDLSDLYQKKGKGGASMLSSVLNKYLGAMVQEILSQGGDVLKFSGDALMVMFKAGTNVSIEDAIHKALDTALIIQKNYGTYQTDVGVVLKIKIAISAGHLSFQVVGTNAYSHYVLAGVPLWECKSVEAIAEPGDVLVSQSGWRRLATTEYVSTKKSIGNLIYYKVTGCSDSWRYIQRHHDDQLEKLETLLDGHDGDNRSTTTFDYVGLDDGTFHKKQYRHRSSNLLQDDLFVRPSMNTIKEKAIKSYLIRFMIPTLRQSILANELMEHPNEMRQVVIVFVNLVTDMQDQIKTIEICDSAFRDIFTITDFYEGTLNKVSLFDKDMMFLIIFGLRGMKHDDQSQTALRCGSEIQKTLSTHNHIKTASVGVTTGSTYCGVVGYEMRREYSVIGLTVNRAARLMMAYPGIVSCDKETFMASNMSSANFSKQERRELKGLHDVGPIYKFSEIIRQSVELIPPNLNFPVLGRDNIIRLYQGELQKVITHDDVEVGVQAPIQVDVEAKVESNVEVNSEADTESNVDTDFKPVEIVEHPFHSSNGFLITGDTKQGKTCMLDKLFKITHDQGIKCFKLTADLRYTKTPYSFIYDFMECLMDSDRRATVESRQHLVVEMLEKFDIPNLYFSLNQVLKTQFPIPELSKKVREKLPQVTERMTRLFCSKLLPELLVFFIDDIDFADENSIILLSKIMQLKSTFCVVTNGNKRKMSPVAAAKLSNADLTTIHLDPISLTFQKDLACRFLKVHALDIDIERMIHMKCKGNPGWMKRLLKSLANDHFISKKQMELHEAVKQGYTLGYSLTSHKSVDTEDFLTSMDETNIQGLNFCNSSTGRLGKDFEIDGNKVINVAILSTTSDINAFNFEGIETAQHLAEYDTLIPFDQLVVKCAAVLGRKFLRSFLIQLMNKSERNVAIAIQRLFEQKIFTCSHGDFSRGNLFYQKQVYMAPTDKLECDCKNVTISENCSDLPAYASCGYIKFKSRQFQLTVYDLLTDDQQREFHSKAFKIFEIDSRRCDFCSNRYFGKLSLFDNADYYSSEIGPVSQRTIFTEGRSNKVGFYNQDLYRGSKAFFRQSIQRMSLSRLSLDWFSDQSRHDHHSGHDSLCLQFGQHNYANCECNMILLLTYDKMIEHAKGANLKEKAIEVMVQQAKICIEIRNYTKSLSILHDVEILIKECYKNKNKGYYVYFWSKIHTHRAEIFLKLNQMGEAYNELFVACKTLRMKLPNPKKKHLSDGFKRLKEVKTLLQKTNNCYGQTALRRSCIYTIVSLQILDTQICLFRYFLQQKNFETCFSIAAYALKKSIKYSHIHHVVIQCYANLIHTAYHIGVVDKIEWVRVKAFEFSLYALKENVNLVLLKAAARLFYSLTLSSTPEKLKDFAINIGYFTLQLNKATGGINQQCKLVPILISLLLSQKRLNDVMTILTRFEATMKHLDNFHGITWYYALCIDVTLDTGVTILSFEECKQFYQENIELLAQFIDKHATVRFHANLLLWAERKNDWDEAYVFFELVHGTFKFSSNDTCTNILNAIRILEAMILSLINLLKHRNIANIKDRELEIRQYIAAIEQALLVTKMHTSRFLLIRAFFYQVINFKPHNVCMLEVAMNQALDSSSFLVYEMIRHNYESWLSRLDPQTNTFWVDRCSGDNPYTETEWLNNRCRLYPYTLPLPNTVYF